MRLYINQMSPYGRKVMVTVHEAGIADKIDLVDVNPRKDPDAVIAVSPMGKIPVLVTDTGEAVRDSPVIAEYIDAEFGGHRLLRAQGADRWRALTRMADADGMIEAAILVRNERLRQETEQSAAVIEWNLGKVSRCMDYFEEMVQEVENTYDLGTISIGSAVGYVPRRIPEFEGLGKHPRLAEFYRRLSNDHPNFAKTEAD